jgi:hypothetical protein
MASFSSRAPVLAALALAACGGGSSSSGVDIRSLVPADGDVGSWTRSGDLRVLSDSQAMLGTNQGGLNGATHPFHDAGLVQVAVQDFTDGTETIKLLVWQSTSVAAAATAYSDSRTGAGSGQPVSIGDEGRITDDNVNLSVDVRKGAYFIDAEINQSDDEASAQVQALVEAVAARIP